MAKPKHTPIAKKQFWLIAAGIFVFVFLLYGNSIKNKYAMDDEIVTVTTPKRPNNDRISKGIKALPEIFSSRHVETSKQRYEYRPMVLATFAIEYELFGANPHVNHFFNVLLYALTCVLLFLLLAKFLSAYHVIFPLLISLLFAAHPMHTEVVDNIKSRDELLALFGGLCALWLYFSYQQSGKWLPLLVGMIVFLLAVMSKKSALAFIGIVPLSLWFFGEKNWKRTLVATLSMLVFFVVVALFISKLVLTGDVVREALYFENPLFVEGSFLERIPVAFYTAWFYLKMLIFPHQLSFYYGYNEIPIAGWSHWQVWLSALIYIALAIFAFKLLRKKHIAAYGLLLYMGVLLAYSNLLIPAIGIVAERFAYTFSIGFCIVLAWGLLKIFRINFEDKTKSFKLKPMFITASVAILGLYSYKTIARNPIWKDHLTLYRHDIKHLEKSAKAHALIGGTLFPKLFSIPNNNEKQKLIEETKYHFEKALEIYPDYIVTNNNLGTVYFTFYADFKSAKPYFKRAVKLDPHYVEAHYNLGYTYEKLGQLDSAIFHFEKTVALDTSNLRSYMRLNNIYFSQKKYKKAIQLSKQGIEILPQNSHNFHTNIANAYSVQNDTLNALRHFIHAFEKTPDDYNLCVHIGKIYHNMGDKTMAGNYFQIAETLRN
ncbi:MAG: hypothetical protein COA57_09635 [Flavobacteriales bacterium]|nr:MAG: hypothetical protein COA57_09635 [Flavobacteriales bacterium]